LYRSLKPSKRRSSDSRDAPINKLPKKQREQVLDILCSEQYIEDSPYQAYSKLLDEGKWYCSIRTMYRILQENSLSRERRQVRRRQKHVKPVVKATGPNTVWSWDITRLPGPFKGKYYFLYVMLDVYSRYVVGWMVSERENADLAQHFIRESLRNKNLLEDSLTIHSDRGSPMKAASTVELIALLGLSQSYSRPRVSNDNAFSESQFKTLKYHRYFRGWYEGLEQAKSEMEKFFKWYNREHRHINLGLLTPAMVYEGRATEVIEGRKQVLKEAFNKYPERFSKAGPRLAVPVENVGINVKIRRKSIPVI